MGPICALGRTPLHIACSVGKSKVVDWLLQFKGGHVNAKDGESGYSALHRAIFHGQLHIAKALVSTYNANLSVQDFDGLTPFHVAVESYSDAKKNECLKIVAKLLEEPIDLNLRDLEGKTGLELAFENECHDIIGMLTFRSFSKPLKHFL